MTGVKLRGIVTVSNDKGEVKYIGNNVVTRLAYNYLYLLGNRPFISSSRRLAISSNTKASSIGGLSNSVNNFNVTSMTNIKAIGWRESDNPSLYAGIKGHEYVEEQLLPQLEERHCVYTAKFPFIGVERIFQTVAVVDTSQYLIPDNRGESNITGAISLPCLAYITFDTPVVQDSNENILISYKIYTDWNNGGINPPASLLMAGDGFQTSLTEWALGKTNALSPLTDNAILSSRPVGLLHPSLPSKVMDSFESGFSKQIYGQNTFESKGSLLELSNTTITRNTGTYSYRINGNIGASTLQSGKLAQGISTGRNYQTTEGSIFTEFSEENSSPIGNVYSHTSDAQSPFQDEAQLSFSTFKPETTVVEGNSNWTTTLPYLYNYKISDNGKYTISKHRTTGFRTKRPFFEPTYWSSSMSVGYISPSNGFHIDYKFLSKINTTTFASCNNDGVSIINLETSAFSNIDISNLSPRQIASDGTHVYVASTTLGLLRINVTNLNQTVLSSTTCYAVDVGEDNVVIAIFSNGVGSSTLSNWGQRYSLVVSDNLQWSRTRFITASSGGKLLINYNGSDFTEVFNGNQGLQVYQRFINATSGIMTSEELLTISGSPPYSYTSKSMVCNRTQALWCQENSRYYIKQGTTIQSYDANGGNKTLISSELTDEGATFSLNYPYLYFNSSEQVEKCLLLQTVPNIGNAGTVISTWSFPSYGSMSYEYGGGYLCVLKGHNWLHLDSDLHVGICWDYKTPTVSIWSPMCHKQQSLNGTTAYGWNGTSWQIGNTGTKSIHSTNSPTIDGLQLRWTDLNSSASVNLIDGDYYTQLIFRGLLLDGYHSVLPYKGALFFRETVVSNVTMNVTGTSMTIPAAASDTLWYRADTEDNTSHSLTLNGVSVTVLFSGSPAINQVVIGANGTITFNSSDIGKVLVGTISYFRKLDVTETS